MFTANKFGWWPLTPGSGLILSHLSVHHTGLAIESPTFFESRCTARTEISSTADFIFASFSRDVQCSCFLTTRALAGSVGTFILCATRGNLNVVFSKRINLKVTTVHLTRDFCSKLTCSIMNYIWYEWSLVLKPPPGVDPVDGHVPCLTPTRIGQCKPEAKDPPHLSLK